jgi:flagellar biosynthesis protein FliQ
MSKALYSVLICLICINVSVAQVQVQINEDVYSFNLAPRLAEVLTPVANSNEWYWPSAQLYNLNAVAIEKQRQTLI